MRTLEQIRNFVDPFVAWASEQADVQAMARVGSYARGEVSEDSDIDLVLLTGEPHKYLGDTSWTERFGTVEKQKAEDYGKRISLRVRYQAGMEVEYGMAAPDRAAMPLNAGTRRYRLCHSREA